MSRKPQTSGIPRTSQNIPEVGVNRMPRGAGEKACQTFPEMPWGCVASMARRDPLAAALHTCRWPCGIAQVDREPGVSMAHVGGDSWSALFGAFVLVYLDIM